MSAALLLRALAVLRQYVNTPESRELCADIELFLKCGSKGSIGKNAIANDGPTVDRVAHSRRAHFRLLSSAKFKNKKGQRIWIQSAWIGPKEWTDRGGQIYRIVERDGEKFKI